MEAFKGMSKLLTTDNIHIEALAIFRCRGQDKINTVALISKKRDTIYTQVKFSLPAKIFKTFYTLIMFKIKVSEIRAPLLFTSKFYPAVKTYCQ